MKLRQLSLAALMLVPTACSETGDVTSVGGGKGIHIGDAVDVDGDGKSDGKAVDSDGDGIADMVDLDGDGEGDVPLTSGGGAMGNTTGSANGNSDGSNGSATAGNNDGKCQEYVVRNERVTPDMLIVLDRSGSMKGSGTNRWDPSVTALKDVTAQLDTVINFGLMIFPGNDSCGAGSVRVPVGPMTAASIATELDANTPNGSTPTSASLEAAHQALGSGLSGPDQVPHPKLVLLVTDGSPNCVNLANNCAPLDFACILQASAMLDQAALTASVDAITAMAADEVKTYVIGYDTKNDASLAGAMDMMAVAGATGDTVHRAVEDSASLITAFEEIVGKAVSCTFVLDEAPPDPSYVLITIDGQQINYNQPDGWILSDDGKKVDIQGKACETLQSGAGQHTLAVEVQCEIVPII